jgi:hypothetical protein
MFDQMYDYFKLRRAACSNACRPVVIHPILISIIFQHYKQLTRLMEQRKAKNTTRELTSTLDLWT